MRAGIVGIVAALVLSGCTAIYERQRAIARAQTVDELCVWTVTEPSLQNVAQEELAERKATCDWTRLQTLLQIRQQQKAVQAQQYGALMGLGLGMMQQAQPQYTAPAPLPTINCQTRYFPWGAQTDCR